MSATRMDPARLGRVAVLGGGWSAEREISLWSGKAVHEALLKAGVDAHFVDLSPQVLLRLGDQGFDRAFNVLHGTGGEDGTVQAILDLIGVPCTGSGVLACALAMDKLRTKQLWGANKLPTPDFFAVGKVDDLPLAAQALGFPFILKPTAEGSSVGISKLASPSAFDAAWHEAAAPDVAGHPTRAVMAERFIDSGPQRHEYSCAVLHGQALPLVRIQPDGDFYDYKAKYLSEQTRYDCPAPLDAELAARCQDWCVKAFESVGAQTWGRVDFMLDRQGNPWLIEVNLVPGMTTHSLVPMAARAAGISFEDLCLRILSATDSEDARS
ncbi:MAG: D-alanine--D-alanine ligase [Panacagrimonas sp.]